MVRLKKQVALNKTNHFLKSTAVLIFFQCNDLNYFHNEIPKLVASIAATVNLEDKKRNDQNKSQKVDSRLKLVKNNYAKKVLIEIESKNRKKGSEIIEKVNKKLSSLALPEGNNLLIGLKNLTLFDNPSFTKAFIDNKTSIDILGGFYGNAEIDHNQIRRLSKICKEKQVYTILKGQMESNAINMRDTLVRNLRFDYLFYRHYRVIALLKSIQLKLPRSQ